MGFSRAVTRMAAALTLVAVTSCGGVAGSLKGSSPAARTATASPSVSGAPEAAALESTFERVIKRVLPAIVQITTTTGLGSGVVYDTAGHIVTNAHVVGKAREFQVTLATGGKPRRATLVNTFPAGDLAMIKVDDPSGLAPATFGRSAQLQVGQIVLAMGNPLGFSGSVTQGIVSALGRTVSGQGPTGTPGATITNAIQTSAPINPGNSGGALVDLSGQVIGIPTLAAVDPELGAAPGIGFAIPSDTATDVAGQIIKFGRVVNSRRAALGVRVGTAVDADGNPIGAVVGALTPGSGAEKAGIKPGDVIVSVGGVRTPTANALSQVLATLRPGDKTQVQVLHPDGRTSTVTVILNELPPTE
ncbi:trypsin-like peptidase domain-containing protein [Planotetraspora sp. A-T 1434]|uniref:S1C family serine protease n=1 Tax=Planotetraspora sp. A-T 1434 TaxID=2979219 RepID=UPI0021BE3C09|nr:trypsin-like peptidase domain-containing protein [Planotetraspora sp. A-T 1434]MCT9928897.1 trypsin-like peptidase domain-containing protein [Planotetraspora sp. A-T 1434]